MRKPTMSSIKNALKKRSIMIARLIGILTLIVACEMEDIYEDDDVSTAVMTAGSTSGLSTFPKPDLVVRSITRNSSWYRVEYCNYGVSGSRDHFTVLLRNRETGRSFQTNPSYPLDVPEPGTCETTVGIICGLIDDPNCNASIDVEAFVDNRDAVQESKETNNRKNVTFETDLVVKRITRNSYDYRVEYCNYGTTRSQNPFTVLLTNKETGESFQTDHLYPLGVPEPGTCETTQAVTCGLIGDPNCDASIDVEAFIDNRNNVEEGNEDNNKKTVSFRPDLVVRSVIRESDYYRVEYCNVGASGSPGQFTILLTNKETGQSFQTNSLYPIDVPEPGTCETTQGIICGLIGDRNCDASMDVEAFIDNRNQVREENEDNNKRTVSFRPDLVVKSITRNSYYYRVEYCNYGTSGSQDGFTVLLANKETGKSFQTNPLHPIDVPEPGVCETTIGIACGLIGDPHCNASIDVEAFVDNRNDVRETTEINNRKTISFYNFIPTMPDIGNWILSE